MVSRPASHLTKPPAQELCGGGQHLGEHSPLPGQLPSRLSIPGSSGLFLLFAALLMAGLTSLESRASGIVSHCYARGAGTALGHRQAQLDSRRPGTGHWLSSPSILLARKAHRMNSVSVSHTCCPRLCPPAEGSVSSAHHRAPPKFRAQAQSVRWVLSSQLGTVYIVWPRSPSPAGPASPRALPLATPLTQGVSSGRSRP